MIRKICVVTFLLYLLVFGNVYAVDKPQLSCKSAVLIDMESGKILYDHNKDIELPQASITKLMTYYVFKDYVKAAKISDEDRVIMEDLKKWNLPEDSSNSDITAGEVVTLNQLYEALLIVSGNDSAMMLMDVYNKSGRDIIADMNRKALELGLNKTKYINVSGLTLKTEAEKNFNVTSAYETAVLGKKLIESYPEILSITSNKYYNYKNNSRSNTNILLSDSDLNLDGLKTGYTGEAGYCLISTEVINNKPNEKPLRLIAVVLGSPTKDSRINDTKNLLKYGESTYSYSKLTNEIDPSNPHFKLLDEFYVGGEIMGEVPDDVYILKNSQNTLSYQIVFDNKLPGKIKKGDKIGKIIINEIDNSKVEYSLISKDDYKAVSFIKKIIINIKHMLKI